MRTNADGWALTKPLVYPAQATSIEILLANLARLTPAVRIDANELKNRPRADEEFGFASPQASIVLRQGEELMRLFKGGNDADIARTARCHCADRSILIKPQKSGDSSMARPMLSRAWRSYGAYSAKNST